MRTDAPRNGEATTELSVDAPADAPACEYCGRPFESEELLALHRGLDHPEAITDTERTAFEEAHDREGDEIRRFRVIALGALVVLYFGFLMVYALV